MTRFLIIQTAFIGDVVLATSLIEKLKFHYPESRIDFLLRKGNEGLLKGHPKLNQTWVWDKKNGKYRELLLLFKAIRSQNYETVINLQRFGATGFLTAFSNATNRIGFAKNPFSVFFTHRYPHAFGSDEPYRHEIDRNLGLIHALTDDQRFYPKLYPSVADFNQVAEFQDQPYICIAPASVWYTKQFPIDKWIEFLNQEEVKKFRVYLIGGPNDQVLCEVIRSKTKHPFTFNLSGQISFLQTAALMHQARMNYSNDSAPLHLASAMDAPVTAIFCSTVPHFGFGPLSDESYVVEKQEKLECRPCTDHGKPECPLSHFKCAYDIDIRNLVDVL